MRPLGERSWKLKVHIETTDKDYLDAYIKAGAWKALSKAGKAPKPSGKIQKQIREALADQDIYESLMEQWEELHGDDT